MDNRQKILIGAIIVIILLLLIGAYAMSGSKDNSTVTPTPTATPTPTPTPVPGSGAGAGSGDGATTPTPAPAATPVPTTSPTSTPTPSANTVMGRQTIVGYWPIYNYTWSSAPDLTPAGKANVSFNETSADLWENEWIRYWVDGGGSGRYVDISEDDDTIIIPIQLNRDGDLTRSYTVLVGYESLGVWHIDLSIQPVTFAAGESSTNMTVELDAEFVRDNDYDHVVFTIEASSDYLVAEDGYEFHLYIND
jgi:hypothetical protein